jgi:hypothetical protein
MDPAATDHHRERMRQFLLERLTGFIRRPLIGWLGLLSKQFFASSEGTYAFEYAGCDSERVHCDGEVLGAWLIDSEGARPIEATPKSVPWELRGMWYRFNQVHFYIAPAGDWVVLACLAGPRAGNGGRYVVVSKGEGFVLQAEGVHWKA